MCSPQRPCRTIGRSAESDFCGGARWKPLRGSVRARRAHRAPGSPERELTPPLLALAVGDFQPVLHFLDTGILRGYAREFTVKGETQGRHYLKRHLVRFQQLPRIDELHEPDTKEPQTKRAQDDQKIPRRYFFRDERMKIAANRAMRESSSPTKRRLQKQIPTAY